MATFLSKQREKTSDC